MKKLLIICQKVDETDDLLGFFVSWIREFSVRYESVTVIALAKGNYALPENVHVFSLGKEDRVSKWQQAMRFAFLLLREVRSHDAVFAHMSPIFAIIAWPFTKIWKKKLVLWYLHRSRTLKLRLALLLVDMLVTADARSLTVKNSKIISVGHGIDVERFAVPDRQPPESRPLRILSVGRLSPIKGFETLIRATAKLRDEGFDCEVRIVGRAVMPGDDQYAQELHQLIARLELGDRVHFFGFVPYRDMPAQYRWADSVVGCTPSGGIDKVLLEAMAAGCVVFTSNTFMDEHLGRLPGSFLFVHGDGEELAARIEAMDAWAPAQEQFVREVRARHDVRQAVERIASIMDERRAS